MKGRTTIIITHRVSAARMADKILVLEDGRMAEAGNHESLLAINGLYADLYERQMKGEPQEESPA